MTELTFGEVRTGLLLNALPLDRPGCEQALDLVEGEAVTWASRPVPFAVSPQVVTGVDCLMPSASGATCRGVGTVAGYACVVGGRVLQASVHTALHPAGSGVGGMRGPWDTYLARPGVIGALGKYAPQDVVSGFLSPARTPETGRRRLAATAVAERLAARVQGSDALDRRPPFRARPTKLRWVAVRDEQRTTARGELTLVDATTRTLLLSLPPEDALAEASLRAVAEDIALHDWLLTHVSETAEGGAAHRTPVEHLVQVVEQLLHLWMPGARSTPDQAPLLALWEELEKWPGLTRQWRACADRLRDQLLVHTVRKVHDEG